MYMYTVDYFIKKFEAIPENLWCTLGRAKGDQRCALGWCYPTKKEALESERGFHKDNEEDRSLNGLIMLLNNRWRAGGVNNGIYEEYQQPTPKQRILAALYDIKAMQQPQYVDITKELAVLPINETTDKIHTNDPLPTTQSHR